MWSTRPTRDMEREQGQLSVVIPTYNRGEQIKPLLECLAKQDIGPSAFEVIIIDDGSDRPVSECVSPGDYGYGLRIIRHDVNRARAAACNTGIKAARGEVVVILDDDITVEPDLLSLHGRFHEEPGNAECAAVGVIEWGSAASVTPSMFFLENTGNFYPLYPRVMRDNLPNMTTANFSIKRSHLLAKGVFDEDFREYGYEDIELGERLRAEGLKFVYLDGANATHHKTFTLDGVIKRQFTSGRMLSLYYTKNGNASYGISSMGMFEGLLEVRTDELEREKGLLAGLEKLFGEKGEDFRELPEFHFYCTKLDGLLSKYNAIGMVEGFKGALPDFEKLFPMILNSIMLARDGDLEAAVAEAARGNSMCADFAPLGYYRAELLCRSGKIDEGCRVFETAREGRPGIVYPGMRLASWKSKMREHDAAVGICREMSERPNINPHWRRHALVELVRIMLDGGMYDEAFAESMKCRERYSSDPYLQYNLASLFEKANVRTTAEDLFYSLLGYLDAQEDCFELRKLRSGIHYHLGMMKLASEQKEEALRDFSWSVRYDVSHRESATRVRQLRSELGIGDI